MGIVEKRGNRYRIRENMPLKDILDSFIRPYVIDRIINRISEYADVIDRKV